MSAIEIYEDDNSENALALTIIDRNADITVFDQESLTVANGTLLDIKRLRAKFDDEFDLGIKQAFAHHRTLVAQKRKWTDPLDEAERILKPKIAAYLDEQDRIRLEAERAAQLAKEAAAKEAEDAADVAHELIQNGELDEAKAIVDMAAENIDKLKAETPIVPARAVAEGATLKTIWDFEIIDENLVPRKFLKVDEVKLRRYIQNMKEQAGEIPGVRIIRRKTIASKIGG